MTFDQLRQQVLDYCNLTSHEAQTRVGKAINRHYRRVTSQLGLEATRYVLRSASTTPGVATVVFTQIEKIDRLLDTTDSLAARLLPEVSLHTLRASQPGASAATCWALQTADADSVTVRLDTVPQVVYSFQADGWTSLADLVSTDAPAFPESFHDILAWFVIAEELLKKEKGQLAAAYETRAERLLADLRFHLADSPTKDTRQRSAAWSALAGSAGAASGGGGNLGGSAYTQTALVTFDRGPGAPPFAVTAGAAVVPNLDADKVDGQHSFDLVAAAVAAAEADLLPIDLASEVTGRVVMANLPTANANRLVGRRDGSDGDLELLTLGTGLSMVGGALTANPTVPSGSAGDVQYNAAGVFGSSGFLNYNSASKVLAVGHLNLANGGNITFPAVAVPSGGATTLDDYRESTWTPTLSFGGGSTGVTYSTRIGQYTVIGNLVHLACWIVLTSKGSSTGIAAISGLPFATALFGLAPVDGNASFAGSVTGATWIEASGVTINFFQHARTVLFDTDFTSATELRFSLTYVR